LPIATAGLNQLVNFTRTAVRRGANAAARHWRMATGGCAALCQRGLARHFALALCVTGLWPGGKPGRLTVEKTKEPPHLKRRTGRPWRGFLAAAQG